MMQLIIFLTFFIIFTAGKQPHILTILVDDVGMNDFGYLGAEFTTPFIDKLANKGTKLTNYYVHATCTPTRAALITGRYGVNVGMEGHLMPLSNHGIPKNMTTLGGALKSKGYRTHLVGKWHLGHSQWDYLPTGRGFDTFVGILSAANGHYTHYFPMPWLGVFDYMKIDEDGTWEHKLDGKYSTEAYTEESIKVIENHGENHSDKPLFLYLSYQSCHTPVQVPTKYLKDCEHIPNYFRKGFCGQIKSVDQSLEEIISAFEKNLGLEDLVIFFSTDNGGYYLNGGSNYPLRGEKTSPFQGGFKVPAFFLDYTKKYVTGESYDGMMHIADILPTFSSWIDTDCPADIDGFDQSNALLGKENSPRNMIVGFWDDLLTTKSIVKGDWKLIWGTEYSNHLLNVPNEYRSSNGIVEEGIYPDKSLSWGNSLSWFYGLIFGHDLGWFYMELAKNLPYSINRLLIERVSVVDDFSNGKSSQAFRRKIPLKWLYNVKNDPQESNDLSKQKPEIVEELTKEIEIIANKVPDKVSWDRCDGRDSAFWYAPDSVCDIAHLMPNDGSPYTSTMFDHFLQRFIPCRFLHPWMEEGETIPKEVQYGLDEVARCVLLLVIIPSFLLLCIPCFMCYACCRRKKTSKILSKKDLKKKKN